MNFRRFNDIGDGEPKAWKPSLGTRFDTDDDECDEVPGPYCDEDAESEVESESEEDDETETETESNKSTPLKRINKKLINSTVLQEESDFMQE
jgi:hypothetical protein